MQLRETDRDGVAGTLGSLASRIEPGRPTEQPESVESMVSPVHHLTLLPRDDNEIVAELGNDGCIRTWDERAERLLGYSDADVTGNPFTSLLTRRFHQAETFREILSDVADDGAPRRFEVEHRTARSGPVLLRGVVASLRGEQGANMGWLLVMHRAIEDHCLECRLLFYLEAITAESGDAIIIMDENDRIRSWNRGAQDIYGFTAEQAVGRPVEVLIPNELLESGELDHIRRTVRERGYIRNYETTRVTADGRRIPVELTRSGILDSQGQLIGTSAIVRDIARRKHLEERLLHTERLAVVGRMAAQVAHELRNPLGTISLNAELLADELGSLPSERYDEAKTLLDSITHEIDRLADVSEEYLQFARLPEFSPAPTDVTLLVEDLAEFAEMEMNRAGVEVIVAAGSVPSIQVDRKQLRQALLNLIRNALEAMSDGGALTLGATTVDDGKSIEISVSDAGPGVSDSTQSQIFDPFFSTKDGGTGLGLSIARRIAHEHGGDLILRETPGGGATFALRLPVRNTETHDRS